MQQKLEKEIERILELMANGKLDYPALRESALTVESLVMSLIRLKQCK